MFAFVLQGNRHYHNLVHLVCMFDFVKRASKAGVTLTDPAAVEWAVWFHDIVYQPSSKSNEADSAELAGKCEDRSGWTQCLTKFKCDNVRLGQQVFSEQLQRASAQHPQLAFRFFFGSGLECCVCVLGQEEQASFRNAVVTTAVVVQ
jgi:hypothetical protein